MKNSNVLVDIDDTLADAQTDILKYVNSRSNKKFSYNELSKEFRSGEQVEYDRYVQEFLGRPDLIRRYRPYNDAIAALKKLHQAGFKIHLASARKENLHQVTMDWLKEHNLIDYVDRIHGRFSDKSGRQFKVATAELIQPVAAFDDTFDVAESLAELNIPVYLIDKPWNQAPFLKTGIIRVANFSKAVDQFLAKQH